MYYDNKRTFYIKQYGPTFIVSAVAVVLIVTGSIIYLKGNSSNNNIASNPSEEVVDVAQNNESVTNNVEVIPSAKKEKVELPKEEVKEEIQEETSALQTVEPEPYFKNLKSLVKSDLVNVASVDNKGNITLDYNGDKITASMIGVSYNYATEDTYNKIRKDLEGKKVKIAFDTLREDENGVSYVYIYLNNELYNATLLKSGLATLKSERNNISLSTDLSKAQAYARDNKQGVWKR